MWDLRNSIVVNIVKYVCFLSNLLSTSIKYSKEFAVVWIQKFRLNIIFLVENYLGCSMLFPCLLAINVEMKENRVLKRHLALKLYIGLTFPLWKI